MSRRILSTCCGAETCKDCDEKQHNYLINAEVSGRWGSEEEQLSKYCPFCRAKMPTDDTGGRLLAEKFEKGNLPLNVYSDLGNRFLDGDGGLEKDVAKGTEILLCGAEMEDPVCQYSIGDSFRTGSGVLPQSAKEAKKWYLAAAQQGHAIAEFELAHMFRDEGNDAEFVRHLRGSASKGFDDACHNLGLAYYIGDCGLPESTEETIRAVTPAAERGDAKCMSVLGEIMCRPEPWVHPPNNPNFTKGMHWLWRAAEKGDQHGISELRKLEEIGSSECFRCHKRAPPEEVFLRCSRCRAAWYCSKNCQVQHWKAEDGGHKQCCIKWTTKDVESKKA